MLTARFEALWSRLIGVWFSYQDAPRDPAEVTQLAAARIALDEARSEIAGERRAMGVGSITNRMPTTEDQRQREMLIHLTLARS